MREKLYTKGPWEVDSYTDEDEIISIANDVKLVNGRTQAKWIAELDINNMDCDFKEFEANASLIASAPDLLEALESMSMQFAEEVADGEYCANYQQAQIAINKAYGRL